LGAKGAKVAITGFQSDANGTAVKASGSYKHDQATVKGSVKLPFKDNTHVNWTGEVTVRKDDWHAGTDVRFDQAVPGTGSDVPSNRVLLNFKAGYVTPAFQATVFAEDQLNKDKESSAKFPVLHLLNFNFLYSLSDAVKFGFGATVERNNARGVEVSAGGEYKVDKDTSLKGKFTVVQTPKPDDREFRVGLSAKQNLSNNVNVTVGADLNARAILGTPGSLGTSKPHSFGFEVKFQ